MLHTTTKQHCKICLYILPFLKIKHLLKPILMIHIGFFWQIWNGLMRMQMSPHLLKKSSLMLYAAYKQQATLCEICLNYSSILKNETFISTNPN